MPRLKDQLPTMLGVKIKIAAAQKNMSIKEVASSFDMAYSNYLSGIIYGKKPPGRYIAKIAEFLHISEVEVYELHYKPFATNKKPKVS